MTRALLLALLLCVAGTASGAGKPIVRAELSPKGQVVPGQQVKLTLTVLVPNFFGGAPQWPAIDLPGAVVTLQEGTASNVSETIGGESYAGIQQIYLVVAQQGGDYTLPPAKIAFKYAAEPGKPPVAGSLALPPLEFSVKGAPGAAAGTPAAPAARVTIKQDVGQAGNTLTRTVDIYAEKTQAMMIPPPEFTAPAGVRVYRKDPVLTDETKDRVGFVGGRRVDRATYLFDKAGDYTLPAIEIAWFNPATQKQEQAVAPAIKVTVAAGDLGKTEIAPEAPAPGEPVVAGPSVWDRMKTWLPLAAVAAAVLALVAWLAHRLAPLAAARLAARRAARAGSEAAFAARVAEACRANDPIAVYRAYLAWRPHAAQEPPAFPELDKLEALLFAGNTAVGWNGAAFAAAFAGARQGRRAGLAHAGALPALNP